MCRGGQNRIWINPIGFQIIRIDKKLIQMYSELKSNLNPIQIYLDRIRIGWIIQINLDSDLIGNLEFNFDFSGIGRHNLQIAIFNIQVGCLTIWIEEK